MTGRRGCCRQNIASTSQASVAVYFVVDVCSEELVSLVTEVLGIVSQMEGSVEPLAHDESLSALGVKLFLSQGLQHNEGVEGNEGTGVSPHREDSGSHDVGAVVFLQVQHVGSGEGGAGEEGNFCDTLGVVESVDNSFVLLPVVVIHFKLC